METRALPVLDFAGDKFTVDVLSSRFTEVAHPDNTIPFGAMESENDHYILRYDLFTHKAWTGTGTRYPARVRVITIPALIAVDPIGTARKYGFPDHAFIETKPEQVPDITQLCRIIPFPDFRNMPRNRA